mgnify:FL=1
MTWPPRTGYHVPAGIRPDAIPWLDHPGYWLDPNNTALLVGYGWPTYQRGAWRTHEGPAYLHAGEMVLPKQVADTVRESSGSISSADTSTVTLNITVNVEGGPVEESIIRRAVKEAVAETETSARIGRLNRIIQEQVR